ncbi:MAG: DUF4214 domain-containing protein, partial [Desulfobacterales bacterium]
MKKKNRVRNKFKILFFLLLTVLVSSAAQADVFLESWESADGIFSPDSLISADQGLWFLGDTVSEFPEDCGQSPHRAAIVIDGDRKVLRLESNDSHSDCSDNLWVAFAEFLPLNLNPGFAIPLTEDTVISFTERGELYDPRSRSPRCIVLPCGDTISLLIGDNRGNALAYLLQHAADAVPNVLHPNYREIFAEPDNFGYQRNLFDDFATIPAFTPDGAQIVSVEFKIQEHGWATIDDLRIATNAIPIDPSRREELIVKYYRDILDRPPDTAGLEGWSAEIERTALLAIDVKEGFIALAKLFFNSAEYFAQSKTNTQYVTDLYQTFFNRAPDPAGLNYWVALLDQGLSQNVVLNFFVYSDEFRLYMAAKFTG